MTESISVKQYLELCGAKEPKQRRRNRSQENFLAQQYENKLNQLRAWRRIKTDFISFHVPNERIHIGSLVSLCAAKGFPLKPTQIKIIGNYLAGFATNLKKAGAKTGICDDVFIKEGGQCFLVEQKFGKGKLSPEQISIRERLKELKIPHYEIRSSDEHDLMLEKEGIAETWK